MLLDTDGVFIYIVVPETGIEPVRPLFTKRRILSPMCLPISPLGHHDHFQKNGLDESLNEADFSAFSHILEARPRVELG